MIHTDGTRTIANTPPRPPASSGRLTDAGYENPRAYDRPGSAFNDRILIDADELERRLKAARREGYNTGFSEGWAGGVKYAHDLQPA